jgi:hypothetical protein
MAYKITHETADQQLTFPNRQAAERYVDQNGGGRQKWTGGVAQPSQPAAEHPAEHRAEHLGERLVERLVGRRAERSDEWSVEGPVQR